MPRFLFLLRFDCGFLTGLLASALLSSGLPLSGLLLSVCRFGGRLDPFVPAAAFLFAALRCLIPSRPALPVRDELVRLFFSFSSMLHLLLDLIIAKGRTYVINYFDNF